MTDLDEVRALLSALPSGPWHVEPGYPQRVSDQRATLIAETYTGPRYPPVIARFIAVSRTLVPALVTEVEHLRAERVQPSPDAARVRDTGDDRHLLRLLHRLRYEMHPAYGTTAHRGRGIGGQAITVQCSVTSPEGEREVTLLREVDQVLRENQELLWPTEVGERDRET